MARVVLIDDELHTALKVQAAKERTSMQSLLSRLVREYLREVENETPSVDADSVSGIVRPDAGTSA